MREDDPAPSNRAARRHFLRVLQKRLTPNDRAALEEDVTGSELQRSIETMTPHRTPGPDGFPACFYQVAPAVFGEILSIVFNYQLKRSILLKCQRTSEVILLEEKNDRADQASLYDAPIEYDMTQDHGHEGSPTLQHSASVGCSCVCLRLKHGR